MKTFQVFNLKKMTTCLTDQFNFLFILHCETTSRVIVIRNGQHIGAPGLQGADKFLRLCPGFGHPQDARQPFVRHVAVEIMTMQVDFQGPLTRKFLPGFIQIADKLPVDLLSVRFCIFHKPLFPGHDPEDADPFCPKIRQQVVRFLNRLANKNKSSAV